MQPSISLMYMINNIGPRTEPCGTLHGAAHQSDCLPFKTTLCLWLDNHAFIQAGISLLMFNTFNFERSHLCWTLLNASAKSRYRISTQSLQSKIDVISSWQGKRLVRHDFLAMKLCCELLSGSCSITCFIIATLSIFSSSLLTILVREIGR